MNHEPKLGQYVRFLTIEARVGPHGVFDTIHGFASAREFADTVNRNCISYHGTAILEFVNHLVKDRQKIEAVADKIIKDFASAVVPGSKNSLHTRAAARFGSVAAAG